jgi:hypothetical protein
LDPRREKAVQTTINCRKSETKLSLRHEQSCPPHGLGRRLPSRPSTPGRLEKNHSAKNPRNPLKSLDSDERIQGNPSLKSGVFKAKAAGAKKTQTEAPF